MEIQNVATGGGGGVQVELCLLLSLSSCLACSSARLDADASSKPWLRSTLAISNQFAEEQDLKRA